MADRDQPTVGVALKPCPHCAGPAEVRNPAGWDPGIANLSIEQVACLAGCTSTVYHPHGRAVSLWNTRAPTDAGGAVSEADVERLSKVYAEATGYYVQFHRGLSSPSSDAIRNGIRAILAAPTPAPQAEGERAAMEAVMSSVDPATWPGLTMEQRANLGRFAKPASQPIQQGG